MGNPMAYVIIEKLQKERKEIVKEIEQHLEMSIAESRADAFKVLSAAPDAADRPGDVLTSALDAAGRARAKTVLGDVDAVASTLGGADAAVVKAIAGGDPVAKAAAELRKAAAAKKITAEQITTTLRGLREEAATRVKLENPKASPEELASKEEGLAADYFARLRTSYDGLAGNDPNFDALLKNTGSDHDATANQALLAGQGRLSDVDELIHALSGNRKDTEAVERVLHGKTALEIQLLKSQYTIRTLGRSLDFDLFGEAPTTAGEENPEFGGQYFKKQGKASGTSRLVLEDYLQQPSEKGGLEEANYILARAEREFDYTMQNRGATGAWRDAWGNEERDLLDESIKDVRTLHAQYERGVLTNPKFAPTTEARRILEEMRLARATIRGDREAYEKATAELRATFEAVAAFALQAALTAVIGPLAEVLLIGKLAQGASLALRIAKGAQVAAVSTASTIGANLAVYGPDYSLEMLRADLLGGMGGALGPAAVEKLLGPFARSMVKQMGTRVNKQILALSQSAAGKEVIALGQWAGQEGMELAKTYAGMQTGALAQTGEFADAGLGTVIEERVKGAAGDTITGGVQKRLGIGEHAGPAAGGETTPEAMPPEVASIPAVAAPDTQAADHAAVQQALEQPADRPASSEESLPDAASKPAGPRLKDVTKLELSTGVDQRGKQWAAEFAPLYAEWPGMSMAARRAWIEARVNARLRAAGLPDVPVHLDGTLASGDAAFDPKDFTIAISEQMLRQSRLTPDDFSALVESVTHEARHAQHHFRGIRAALQDNRFSMQAGIADHVVEAAQHANTHPKSAETMSPEARAEALEIYDATHGAGKEDRRNIIRTRNAAEDRLRAAKKRVKALENTPDSPEKAAAAAEHAAAQAAYHDAHNAYVALPQEIDAHRRGFAAGKAAIAEISDSGPSDPRTMLASVTAAEARASAELNKALEWQAAVIEAGADPTEAMNAVREATDMREAARAEMGRLQGEITEPHDIGRAPTQEVPAVADPTEPHNIGEAPTQEMPVAAGADEDVPDASRRPIDDGDDFAEKSEEVRTLVKGEGVTQLHKGGDIEASNAEVEAAQQVLKNPNASVPEVVQALRTLVDRAIAEFRADFTARAAMPKQVGSELVSTGERAKLDAHNLSGMCGGGRDITAEAILALVKDSAHEIWIERIQVAHLGVPNKHAFSVITLADGTRFLVDPTFAQFADVDKATTFSAEGMLSTVEGNKVAAELLRHGVVELTDDIARQYFMGLGADAAVAEATIPRLLGGAGTVLTEIVKDGQIDRFQNRPDEELATASDVGESDTADFVRDIRARFGTIGTRDATRRALVESLLAKLVQLGKQLKPLVKPRP
jgi:hypothetical protein